MTDSENDLFFIDTNVLVYAYDYADKEKNKPASEFLSKLLIEKKEFCISNQILAEFFYVITKKKLLTLKVAGETVSEISCLDTTKIFNYSTGTTLSAISIMEKYSLHFWDALIIATMLENNVFTIYTENTKDFSRCDRVKAINPFV
jgi:predicted nucleic acid-binding protein